MNKSVYISAACAISPQHSFQGDNLLQPLMSSNDNRLFVTDQDYSKYISPVAIRRMSRLLKMGISTAMKCVADAGNPAIDGIITGTARGSVVDMERFLKDMIALNEEALNPTYFIQSTYNSINGWLAMQTKCTGYNQTFVHRGFSFELALLDAQMLLQETNDTRHYLAGCYDEITDDYCRIKAKAGYWKKESVNSLALFTNTATPGTIAGEGAAFFMLTNSAANALCKLSGVDMLQSPAPEYLVQRLISFLFAKQLALTDIDMLLFGMNGDARNGELYDAVLGATPESTTVCVFKHLSGEYDTSSGFALWLATRIFTTQHLLQETIYRQGSNTHIHRILIVNPYILNNVTIDTVGKSK